MNEPQHTYGRGEDSSSSSSDDFRDIEARLKTFETWPNPNISPQELADAGFYYIRIADIVKCGFCGTEGYSWLQGDDPLDDHTRWRPDCPFIRSAIRNRRRHDPEDEETETEELICKICYINKMKMLFRPCCHFYACIRCGRLLSYCALCRERITYRDIVFMS